MSFGPRLCDRWQKESKDIENETAGLHVPTGLQLTASKHIEDQLGFGRRWPRPTVSLFRTGNPDFFFFF